MAQENEESTSDSKGGSSAAWIALAAALGITAGAFILAKRLRSGSVRGRVDNLFSACDRAAKALDDRLGINDMLYARQ